MSPPEGLTAYPLGRVCPVWDLWARRVKWRSQPYALTMASTQPQSFEEANQRYEELKKQLKEALEKKRQLDHDLTDLESQIYLYEGSYLNSTALSGGNVIRGFDTYVKANVGAVPGNRASGNPNSSSDDRMFSSSSATYQRSLALKANEPGTDSVKTEESTKTNESTSQSSGYKLKRKTDELAKGP